MMGKGFDRTMEVLRVVVTNSQLYRQQQKAAEKAAADKKQSEK